MRFLKFIFLFTILSFYSCQGSKESDKDLLSIEKAILEEPNNFFYIDFKKYPKDLRKLPIGVFDSGTGGLTILDALIRYDAYQNGTVNEGPDDQADFKHEKFIYLADQANMPYGNYFAENKTTLLQEHIIKDIQFLLGNKYYKEDVVKFQEDKEHVKAIVVACNTATAYGFREAESFLQKLG